MQKKTFLLVSSLILCAMIFCGCGRPGPTWQEQYDLGVRYLSEGNYEEAILAFDAAIQIDPKRAEAYIGLADAYIGQGDMDSAVAALQQGLSATGDTALQERLDRLQQDGAGHDGRDPAQDADGTLPSDLDLTTLYSATAGDGLRLTVQVGGSRTGSVTLSGLSLQDSYTVDRSETMESLLEYGWEVFLYGAQTPIAVGTTSWCWSPGLNETRTLADMQHNLWGPSAEAPDISSGNVADAEMYHTADSITWIFTVPEEYAFDFADIDSYHVEIFDITRDAETGPIEYDFTA